MAGRPTDYSVDVAARLCGMLATGMSLRTACKQPDMPCTATVYNWFARHPEFVEQYARAKEESADALIEEILDISDDGTNDWMEKNDQEGNCTGYQFNGEHVQRSKLRVDARKWVASKLKPKKYGDRVTQEHTGPGGGPIKTASVKMIAEAQNPQEATRIYHDFITEISNGGD